MRLGLAANRLHHARPDAALFRSLRASGAGIRALDIGLHAVGRTFDARTLAFGLAAARLKHSVPGDFNLVGIADVDSLVDSGRLDVRR